MLATNMGFNFQKYILSYSEVVFSQRKKKKNQWLPPPLQRGHFMNFTISLSRSLRKIWSIHYIGNWLIKHFYQKHQWMKLITKILILKNDLVCYKIIEHLNENIYCNNVNLRFFTNKYAFLTSKKYFLHVWSWRLMLLGKIY